MTREFFKHSSTSFAGRSLSNAFLLSIASAWPSFPLPGGEGISSASAGRRFTGEASLLQNIPMTLVALHGQSCAAPAFIQINCLFFEAESPG